jgi:hypothetical protein
MLSYGSDSWSGCSWEVVKVVAVVVVMATAAAWIIAP